MADSVDINGVSRNYMVQLAEVKPAPLVIVLHGKTQSGADMAKWTSRLAVVYFQRIVIVQKVVRNHSTSHKR